jgi:hypothetical protein
MRVQLVAGMEEITVSLDKLTQLYHLSVACAALMVKSSVHTRLPPSLDIMSVAPVSLAGDSLTDLKPAWRTRPSIHHDSRVVGYGCKLGTAHDLDLGADDLGGPMFTIHRTF